jgi:hypothetical protein
MCRGHPKITAVATRETVVPAQYDTVRREQPRRPTPRSSRQRSRCRTEWDQSALQLSKHVDVALCSVETHDFLLHGIPIRHGKDVRHRTRYLLHLPHDIIFEDEKRTGSQRTRAGHTHGAAWGGTIDRRVQNHHRQTQSRPS